jgi:low affinity Fe/Cu permease
MEWLNEKLEGFSKLVTHWAGSSWAFSLACFVVLGWAVTGPIFNYSENWQLVINTSTTIVTFLMVFLVQRTQNKESLAVNVKLNELLASQKGASNNLINLEDMSEHQINALHKRFSSLAERLKDYAENCDEHSVTEVADEAQELMARTGQKVNGKQVERRRHDLVGDEGKS